MKAQVAPPSVLYSKRVAVESDTPPKDIAMSEPERITSPPLGKTIRASLCANTGEIDDMRTIRLASGASIKVFINIPGVELGKKNWKAVPRQFESDSSLNRRFQQWVAHRQVTTWRSWHGSKPD
jgi:hypothetical protein